MSTSTTLTFLGAAGSVTGSKFLITSGERRILVDCGMFQGEKELRKRNWADFPVDPATITDVLLTHAHLDHCGYLPAIVKQGFRGRIRCTQPTTRLAEIILRDAGYLQERDAQDAASGGWSKHRPPLPLYDSSDVERTLPLFTSVDFDTDVDLGDDLSARWVRAGHILGSASIRMATPGGSVLFSGDLGRIDHPVLRPREIPPGADYVLIESTYGDREHPDARNLEHEKLADVIRRTIHRGGSVLIPAFAVDRTEIVLKVLGEMMRHQRIPRVPVYVNSPMANSALDVYRDTPDELRQDIDAGAVFDVGELHEVRTADESRELTRGTQRPSIIISSSGMATGGRVLHHLERMLPDSRNAVILTGYQAIGTRGRSLAEGATRLKIRGHYVGVRAEILQDDEFSVHADAADLLGWLAALEPKPLTVFTVHGEAPAAQGLAERIEQQLGLAAVVPALDEVVVIDAARHAPAPADVHAPAQADLPVARGASAPAGAPAGAPAAGAAGLVISLDGMPLTGAQVTSQLTARPGEQPDEIVLEGSITIRLRRD